MNSYYLPKKTFFYIRQALSILKKYKNITKAFESQHYQITVHLLLQVLWTIRKIVDFVVYYSKKINLLLGAVPVA